MIALATLAAAAMATAAAPVDRVVIDKTARTLTVMAGDAAILTVPDIRLGDAPQGRKQFRGDERTPEGDYVIDRRNPASAYHLSLHISYPDAADRAYAAARGRSPGGDIFIHGQPNGSTGTIDEDWTDGCVALPDDAIEAVWDLVPDGTAVRILP